MKKKDYLYILTRNGNIISDKAISTIINAIGYNNTNNLIIEMGGDINNQLNMKKKLTKFPGNIVIVETDNDTRMSDGLFIVGDGNIEKAKNVLSSINTKTSYDVLRNWYNENV